jgi:inner membrane protein
MAAACGPSRGAKAPRTHARSGGGILLGCMDTLTHALSGALVARLITVRHPVASTLPAQPADLARFGAAWDGRPGAVAPWQAVVVGTLAGAFPDIDSVAQIAGDFAYLQHHRGITHSLPMAPLWALLLSWVATALFADRRGRPGAWKGLYPIVLAALLVHIAGDWITQFGTMLLAPFSDARFGLGAMFIIDLSFSGLLVAGLVLASVFPRQRWPAATGLAAVAGWVVLAWIGKQEAEAIGARHAAAQGIAVQWVDTMPRPASPFNWTVTVFDGERYHVAHVNTRRTEPLVATADDHFIRRFSAPYQPAELAQWQQVPRFGDDAPAWVRDAWAHESFATYRWFAVAPALVSATEQRGGDGTVERCAVFRDLRFEFPGRDESPFRYGVCLRDGDTARLVRIEDGRQHPV